MNHCNINSSTASSYISGTPALSPYSSDCNFSPVPQSQIEWLETFGFSREDCSSACSSSVSDRSELECQMFPDTMIYKGTTSAAPTVDPSLFVTPQGLFSHQLLMQQQHETQQEKVLSPYFYRHQNIYQTVNMMDGPNVTSCYQSPMMSAENTFENSLGLYSYASSNIRPTNSDYNHTSNNNNSNYNNNTFIPCYNQQYNQVNNYSSSKRVKYEQQDSNFLPSKQQANNYHMTNKSNSSNNIFPCTEPNCNKSFTRPYNLKSHMRTHTQERPYGCHYKPCGWKFARPHDLKRHELQHSGLKPHGCSFCHRSFARSDALKRHWKVDASCSQALKQDLLLNGSNASCGNKRKRSSKIAH